MPSLPSGTVTFLFTDIEGSSTLWEQHPEAMKTALRRHDEMVRRAIESNDGAVVKTTGDGFHAAFSTADSAVEAAIQVQVGLDRELWPETGPLRVRIGLHTGTAEMRDGDYFGPALNRAARLMAAACGGQILCSQATVELSGDSGAARAFRDLGEHRLRGLSRPERVYQVVAPDLRGDFARLRSETRPESDLPSQLTSFVGREGDLEGITQRLRETRLLTLTGVGGVGKTRLAIEVARRIQSDFADGARLCELAPATDESSMIEIISVRLGVVDRPGMSRRQSTLDALAHSELLFLLDNCEHLLDPVCELVSELLESTHGVTVLATSREPLNVEGEDVWPLRPLSVPRRSEDGAAERTESVDLFVDRARSVRPTFAVDDQTREAIGDICRRLDGMPLAIELAAARVVAMQPAEIAARLGERFRLLSGGRRTRVERHQTLRATVDWSYSLLTESDRTTFARLSVFPASFDTPAAMAVAGGDGVEDWDVIDALESLVAKSMILTEDAGDGSTRFSMLETLRQYGREKLAEGGEVEISNLKRRHAAHYADLAVELGPLLTTRDEVVANRRIVQEIENFRAGIAWALDAGDGDETYAVRIAGWLVPIVTRHRALGFGSDVERCADAALRSAPGLRFAVLGGAAVSAISRGDLERTRSWLADAFREPPVIEVVGSLSPAYTALALLEVATDVEMALEKLERGAVTAEASNQPFDAVVLLAMQATFSALSGRTEAGHRLSEDAVTRARELGNPTALAIATYIWATVHWMDDPSAARAALEESVALTESGASDVIYGDTQELLARLEALAGDLPAALRTIKGALDYSTSVGNRPSVVGHLWYAGEILGNSEIEAEFVAVTHGVCTRNTSMPAMVQVEGREREIHESALEHTQMSLGADRFEALVERGGRMEFREIVDYSLRELDRIITEPGQL